MMAGLDLISSTYDRIRHDAMSEATAYGSRRLTVQQHFALEAVQELVKRGQAQGASLNDLVKYMHMRASAASLMVENLVGRGLVERTRSMDDRRAICVTLTEEGVKALKRGTKALNKRVEMLSEKLTPEEEEQLLAIIAKICN